MQRDVVSIFGATGWGKSTLLRALLKPKPRVVLIDPAGGVEWERSGFERAPALSTLSLWMAQCWYKRFKIVYTPPAHACETALDTVSQLYFAYAKRAGRIVDQVLAVDEMAECYSTAHAMQKDLRGYRAAILQGRHIGLSLYGASQFPADVATRFRNAASVAYFFGLHDGPGRDAALRKIGREHAAALAALKPYEYLEYRAGEGQLIRGRTRA